MFVAEASAIFVALSVALLFILGTIDGAEILFDRGFGFSGVRDSDPYETGGGREVYSREGAREGGAGRTEETEEGREGVRAVLPFKEADEEDRESD